MAISNQGTTVSYAGIDFGPAVETRNFTCRPVVDASGRTIARNDYSATFRVYLTGQSVGAVAYRLRQVLTKNGQPLVITGRPFGNVVVNVGNVRDVTGGPWPKELAFSNVAGRSCELVFSVEWSLPECPDAVFVGRPMEFSYTVQTQVDEAGYTVRTTSLKVKIPQNRLVPGSRTPQDSADLYLEQLTPQLARGFRRKFGPRTLNEDRSEMTWSVIDEELTGPAPPPGIVKEEGSVDYSSDNAAGAAWVASVRYNCEVAKGGSLNTAIDAAVSFISHRRAWLQNAAGRVVEVGGRAGGQEQSGVVPLRYRIAEPEALGRNRFEMSVDYTVTATLANMLARSGLWSASPDRGNWPTWAASLLGSAFNPRGSAGIIFTPGQDVITDLCGFARPLPPRDIREVRANQLADAFDPVERKASWLYYRNAVYRDQDSGTATLRTLPPAALDEGADRKGQFNAATLAGTLIGGPLGGLIGGGIRPGGGLGGLTTPPGARLVNEPAYGDNSSTRVARPQQYIVMSGEALRVGFPVPEPVLLEAFGLKLIPANRLDRGEGFRQAPVWHNGLQPFYYARWKLRYAVDGDLPNGDLPVAPNPMYPT